MHEYSSHTFLATPYLFRRPRYCCLDRESKLAVQVVMYKHGHTLHDNGGTWYLVQYVMVCPCGVLQQQRPTATVYSRNQDTD